MRHAPHDTELNGSAMSTMHDRPDDVAAAMSARNRRVAVICAGVVACMLGLAYASVPLYDLFCRVTGYGGTTQRAERPAGAASVKARASRTPGIMKPSVLSAAQRSASSASSSSRSALLTATTTPSGGASLGPASMPSSS